MKNAIKQLFTIQVNQNRIYGLDIIRAVAILFVLVEHGGFLLPKGVQPIYKFFVFDGVAIFFVLSGFLIGQIIIKTFLQNTFTIKDLFYFWIRRWFRTLPNYFLILTALIISRQIINPNFNVEHIERYLYFGQNLFRPHPAFFAEVWSLSIEEWFYLLIPLLLYSFIKLFKKAPHRVFITLSFIIIIATVLYRYKLYNTIAIETINTDLIFRKQVFTRLDSLMIGLLASYVYVYHKQLWQNNAHKLFITSIVLLLSFHLLSYFSLIGNETMFYLVFSYLMIAILIAFLLPYLSSIKKSDSHFSHLLTKVSLVSYAMYLINLSVVQFSFLNFLPWRKIISNEMVISILNYMLFWFLTYYGSILIYKYYELPSTQLREHKIIQQLFSKT